MMNSPVLTPTSMTSQKVKVLILLLIVPLKDVLFKNIKKTTISYKNNLIALSFLILKVIQFQIETRRMKNPSPTKLIARLNLKSKGRLLLLPRKLKKCITTTSLILDLILKKLFVIRDIDLNRKRKRNKNLCINHVFEKNKLTKTKIINLLNGLILEFRNNLW